MGRHVLAETFNDQRHHFFSASGTQTACFGLGSNLCACHMPETQKGLVNCIGKVFISSLDLEP